MKNILTINLDHIYHIDHMKGYHVYQPIDGVLFEKYRDLNDFSDLNLFNEFLRFSKKFLSFINLKKNK